MSFSIFLYIFLILCKPLCVCLVLLSSFRVYVCVRKKKNRYTGIIIFIIIIIIILFIPCI
jgi:hypothetical protein